MKGPAQRELVNLVSVNEHRCLVVRNRLLSYWMSKASFCRSSLAPLLLSTLPHFSFSFSLPSHTSRHHPHARCGTCAHSAYGSAICWMRPMPLNCPCLRPMPSHCRPDRLDTIFPMGLPGTYIRLFQPVLWRCQLEWLSRFSGFVCRSGDVAGSAGSAGSIASAGIAVLAAVMAASGIAASSECKNKVKQRGIVAGDGVLLCLFILPGCSLRWLALFKIGPYAGPKRACQASVVCSK